MSNISDPASAIVMVNLSFFTRLYIASFSCCKFSITHWFTNYAECSKKRTNRSVGLQSVQRGGQTVRFRLFPYFLFTCRLILPHQAIFKHPFIAMRKPLSSKFLHLVMYGWLPLLLLYGDVWGQATQSYRFNGRILDEKGTGLPGATVVLKGDAKSGTTSDADGKFTINLPTGGGTLVVSAIGYLGQEVAVTSQTTLDITMSPDIKTLNEVVVVGYGTQKKENLTGAVAAITIDDKISSRAVANVSSGLSGLVPGLSVQQSTGQAGRSGAALIIRGLGTVNNSGPLIVVDGMPDVDINRIDMNDVASISVLKDAASASVYGSRASNGVVLITTKNGSQNKKAQINYTGTYGLSQPTNFYNYFADYPRSLTMHLRASGAGASSTTYRYGTVEEWLSKGLVDPIKYPNTDWWKTILRDHGRIQTHNISASGGNDKMNFYLSAGLYDELGVLINHDYKRFNTRFNLDYKIRDNVKVGIRTDGQWSNQKYANSEGFITYTGTAGYDIRYAIAGILPYNSTTGQYGGIMAYGEDAFARNMLSQFEVNHNFRDRQEFNGNLYGEWTPISGLTVRGDYGLRYYNQFTKSYSDPTDEWNFQTGQLARTLVAASAGISNAVNSGYKTLLQGRITYNKTLFGNHQLSLLGAYTEEYWFNRNLSASRQDRINPLLSEIDAALTTTQSAGGNSDAEGLRSGIGRINYVINDKYLFEVNARYDGSSKFLPGFQYGFFPSASAGWRFSGQWRVLEYSCTFRCYSRVATTRLPLALACAPDHTYSSICGAISGQGLLPHRPSPPPSMPHTCRSVWQSPRRPWSFSRCEGASRERAKPRWPSASSSAHGELLRLRSPYASRHTPSAHHLDACLSTSLRACGLASRLAPAPRPSIARATPKISLSRRTHFQPTSTPPPTDFHPSPPLFLSACHLAYLPACLPCPPSVRSRT